MFGFLKNKSVQKQPEIRDTLFGDRPLSYWAMISNDSEPWVSFRRAKEQLDSGDIEGATAVFRSILLMPQLESRQYLQAYRFLRELNVNPPKENEKEVLGVVVEVGMPKGLDLLAAYADHHARYYSFSGAGVVWERPNDLLDASIDELLLAAKTVLQAIGVWRGDRPPAPNRGIARINLLTPSGLHFGQDSLDILSKDRLGGPVLASAFALMQELINLTKK